MEPRDRIMLFPSTLTFAVHRDLRRPSLGTRRGDGEVR